MKKYLIVFEKTSNNFSAYLPDLPGCIATGKTRTEVEKNIREAIALHLQGMRADGNSLPEPTSYTELVEV
ncbi:MAG: type II toxin-antitoxin system HicB family antitoxin [Dehalococcoidales bacterium]|nr:type II toxin-antitoxin system HicB family antitoxin [Dehalococcoidales bacterium]